MSWYGSCSADSRKRANRHRRTVWWKCALEKAPRWPPIIKKEIIMFVKNIKNNKNMCISARARNRASRKCKQNTKRLKCKDKHLKTVASNHSSKTQQIDIYIYIYILFFCCLRYWPNRQCSKLIKNHKCIIEEFALLLFFFSRLF